MGGERRKEEEEGGGRSRELTTSLICLSERRRERKSSRLCCRVPEEGESVITQGERWGGREKKKRDVRQLETEQETETDRESKDIMREEKKRKETTERTVRG